jgi:hypothetical protein
MVMVRTFIVVNERIVVVIPVVVRFWVRQVRIARINQFVQSLMLSIWIQTIDLIDVCRYSVLLHLLRYLLNYDVTLDYPAGDRKMPRLAPDFGQKQLLTWMYDRRPFQVVKTPDTKDVISQIHGTWCKAKGNIP